MTGELITDSSEDNAYTNPLGFSQWGGSIGSAITDDKDKLIGYGNYLREFNFEKGSLTRETEIGIGNVISSKIAQLDPEYKFPLDAGSIDTDANLIGEAFGQQAKENYLDSLNNGGFRDDFSAEVNEAKQHLVEHGKLSLASLRTQDSEGAISYELIGDSNILDKNKAVAESLTRGAIRHNDLWQVAKGMKDVGTGVNAFKAIRDNQVRAELSAASQADDKELYNEILQDAKNHFVTNDEESDPSTLITKARTLLARGYSSNKDIPENVSRDRFQDSDIMDALEQVSAFQAYQGGEVDFVSDPNKLGDNIKTTKNGAVIPHIDLLLDRGKFDSAIELRNDLSATQKTSLRNYRKDFFTRQFPQYDEIFKDSTVETKWGEAKIEGKQKGLSNGDILEKFIADPKNYSGVKNRMGALGDSIVDSFTGLAVVIPALFENEGAIDFLVEQEEDRQNRRAIAQVFGDKFGLGVDVSTAIAPMVVDVTATALLSSGTFGLGGATYLTAKQGARLTAKGAIKSLTGSVLKKEFGETGAEAALRLKTKRLISFKEGAQEKVGETINSFNSLLTRSVSKGKGSDAVEKQVRSRLVSGVQTSALFLTAANRSSGATYATVYSNLEGTHAEKHDAALGAALTAGMATGLITAGFSSVGAGGFEDAFLKGITAKQHRSLLERMLRTKIAKSKYGELMTKYLRKRIKDVTPQVFGGLYRSYLKSGTEEFFEEGIDEFVNSFIVDAALNEDTPMIDRVTGAMYAGLVGGIIGQGAAGVRSIADKHGAFARGEIENLRLSEEEKLISFLEDNNSPLTAGQMRRITQQQLRTPASQATDEDYESAIGSAIRITEQLEKERQAAENANINVTRDTTDTSGKLGSTPRVETKVTQPIDGEETEEASAEITLYIKNIANDFNAEETLPYLSGQVDSPTSEQKKEVFKDIDLVKLKAAFKDVEGYARFIEEHEKAHIRLGHAKVYPKDLLDPEAIKYEREANEAAARVLGIDWNSLKKREGTVDTAPEKSKAEVEEENEKLFEGIDNLSKEDIEANFKVIIEDEKQQKADDDPLDLTPVNQKFDVDGNPILSEEENIGSEEFEAVLAEVRNEEGYDLSIENYGLDEAVPFMFRWANSNQSALFKHSGRAIVFKKVNGVVVTFYLSSGRSGSGGQKKFGSWYPIFGIGKTKGWFYKGVSFEDVNNYQNSPSLREAVEELNDSIGDIRGELNRLMPIEEAELRDTIEYHMGIPPLDLESPSEEKRKGIASAVEKIEKGLPETNEESLDWRTPDRQDDEISRSIIENQINQDGILTIGEELDNEYLKGSNITADEWVKIQEFNDFIEGVLVENQRAMDLTDEELSLMYDEFVKNIEDVPQNAARSVIHKAVLEAHNEIRQQRENNGLGYNARLRQKFADFEQAWAIDKARESESKPSIPADIVFLNYSYLDSNGSSVSRTVRLDQADTRIKELEEDIKNFKSIERDDTVDDLKNQIASIRSSLDGYLDNAFLKPKEKRKQEGYAKSVEKGVESFEVSTAGNTVGKKFSPLNAKIKWSEANEFLKSSVIPVETKFKNIKPDDNGEVSIEELYQAAKGTGKGLPPTSTNFPSYRVYKGLWEIYFENNPTQLEEIGKASSGKILTDQYAANPTPKNKFGIRVTSQARAIHEILVAKELRDPSTLQYVAVFTPQTTKEPTVVVIKKEEGDTRPTWKVLQAAAKSGKGINTLREEGENHFGNPFSNVSNSRDTIKTSNLQETLDNYEAWLEGKDFKNVKQKRRNWVLKQINEGKLDGQNLLYFKGGTDNHATILKDFVIKQRSFSLEQETAAPTKPLNVNLRYSRRVMDSGRIIEEDELGNLYVSEEVDRERIFKTEPVFENVKLNEAPKKLKELEENLRGDTEAFESGSEFGSDILISEFTLANAQEHIEALRKVLAEVTNENDRALYTPEIDQEISYSYDSIDVLPNPLDTGRKTTKKIKLSEAKARLLQLDAEILFLEEQGNTTLLNELGIPIPNYTGSEEAVLNLYIKESDALRPIVEIYENKILQRATTKEIETVISDGAKKAGYLGKEQVKTRKATQFIGQGAKGSSTDRYYDLYNKRGRANTGNYKSSDVIFVASNGKRKNSILPIKDGELLGEYKLIDKAMEKGATIVMDTNEHLRGDGLSETKQKGRKNYLSTGEIPLAIYLNNNGYSRVKGTGEWIPEGSKEKDTEVKYSFTPNWSNGIPITKTVKYNDINNLLQELDDKVEFVTKLDLPDSEGVRDALREQIRAVSAAKNKFDLEEKLNNVNNETTESQIRNLSPQDEFDSLEGNQQDHLLKVQGLMADLTLLSQMFGVQVKVVPEEQRQAAEDAGKPIKPFSYVVTDDGETYIQIEPNGLVGLVKGLSDINAKALTSSIVTEEIIHAATFADLTSEEISDFYNQLPTSEINKTIDTYYQTEEDRQAARARLYNEDSEVSLKEQRTLAKEALRMHVQRAVKGFTTEEDKAFYMGNPNIIAALLRYLKGFINRITTALKSDSSNPYMSMSVNRVVQAYNDMKAGYQIGQAPSFDPDNPLKVVSALKIQTETSEEDTGILPETGSIIEMTQSQVDGNTTTETTKNEVFKYGNLTGMLTLPLMKTGKYRGEYKGLMSWMNKLVGKADPRLQRLHQQGTALRNAVFNEIQRYKDRLDVLVAKEFPEGAPVDLFRSITGDAEVLKVDEATTELIRKTFDAKLKRLTQALADLNEQLENEPNNKEVQINIKQVTSELKSVDDEKTLVYERAYQNRRAVLEQQREYAIEQLGGYDDNGDPKSEIVRHLLALRGKTDEFSKKIGELFPNDPDIKKTLNSTIDANLEVYLTRQYKLFSEAGFTDSVMYDSKYDLVRSEAADFFSEEYRNYRGLEIILKKEKDSSGNVITNLEHAKEIADKELRADPTKSPSDQPPLIHNMMVSFLNSFSNKDNLFTSDTGVKLVEGDDAAKRMGFTHILKERLKERKDVPAQLRALMGEEGDATGYDAVMRTYMHVGIMASHQAYLKNVLDFGMKEKNGWIIEETEWRALGDDQKNWERVVGDGDYRYDPWVNVSQGKKYYVPTDMKVALKSLGDMSTQSLNESEVVATELNRMAHNLTGLSMASKTLGSIGFYFRNIIGNVVYFGLSQGMIAPIRYTKNGLKELVRHRNLYTGDRFSQIKLDEYYSELDALDIIGDEIRPKMLDEIFKGETTPNDLMNEVYATTKQLDGLTDDSTKESDLKKLGTPINKLYSKLKDLSAVVDTFYKISYYEHELAVLQKAKKKGQGKYANMTDYEIKREAADKVLSTAQSYSRASPLVRGWTNSSVGVMFAPFIRFKGEIVRISVNTIRLAVQEIKDPSTVIRLRGLRRLTGFLGTTVGLSAAAPLAMRSLNDVDDEEDAALRRTLVEYLRGHTFFIYREGNDLKTLDFTYLNPYALLADPVLRSVEKGFRGESPAAMGMSFIEGLILNEYLDDQIFAGAFMALKSNRDPQTNKKIWEERDTAEDVFIKGAGFLLKEALEPRTIKAGREVKKMIGTSPVEDIFERIGKEFYPAKPYTIDISNNMRRYLFDVRRETQNISLRKNIVLSDNPLTDNEIKGLVLDEIDHRLRLDKEVAHTLKNLASLGGLSDEEVRKIVFGSQFGKRRYGFLLKGVTETPRETHKGLKKKLRDKYKLTGDATFLRRERLLSAYFKNLPRFYRHDQD